MSYVRWDGDWAYNTPGVLTDATMIVTPLVMPKASRTELQDLCDRLINNVQSRVTASPWTLPVVNKPLLLLAFADFPQMRSKNPPDRDYGYVSERDVAIFVPIELHDSDGKRIGIRLLNPFIWVSSHIGVLNGRETFGFPKIQADIGWDPRNLAFSVDTDVWVSHDVNTPATKERLLELKWTRPPLLSAADWQEFREVEIPELDERDPLGHARAIMLEELDGPSNIDLGQLLQVPLVLLKQFREVTPGPGTDYQEIVGASFKVTSIPLVHLYPKSLFRRYPLELSLSAFASVDIAKTLGIPLTNGKVRLNGPVVSVKTNLELVGHRI